MTLEFPNLTVSANGTLLSTKSVPFLAIKEKVLGKRYDLSIAFVSSTKAQKINIESRSKDYIPNTLSFSLDNSSGEIIMCMSAIKKQYREFDMNLDTYTIFLLIHSMLHLKGMEHGSTMERKEKQLLTFFTSTPIKNETIHRSRH